MKKLEISQMENLQGGFSAAFNRCMNYYMGQWQLQVALGFAAIIGGGYGLAGGVAAIATRCNQLT